jgi:hypothetical protein
MQYCVGLSTNLKYFHILANNRKKNLMLTLSNGSDIATSQTDKYGIVFENYQNHIGTCTQWKHRLNLAQIGWQPQQLQHLDAPFTETQVAATIKAMPKEKSGPDDFIVLQVMLEHYKGRHNGSSQPVLLHEQTRTPLPKPNISDAHSKDTPSRESH